MAKLYKVFGFVILGLITWLMPVGAVGCTYNVDTYEGPEDSMGRLKVGDIGIADGETGGWSANGKILPSTRQGVSLQAVFPVAGSYTIQFDLDPSGIRAMGLGETISAEADITWVVEGNFVTRTVSCVRGMSITGVAQGARVVIRDTSHITGAAITVPYIASIQIAPGTRASTQQPPFLDKESQLILGAGPANITIPIDQNAGIISVFVAVSPIAGGGPIAEFGFLVNHVNDAGTRLKTYDPRDYTWVPLAPGATFLLVESAAGVPALFVSPVFGIDG